MLHKSRHYLALLDGECTVYCEVHSAQCTVCRWQFGACIVHYTLQFKVASGPFLFTARSSALSSGLMQFIQSGVVQLTVVHGTDLSSAVYSSVQQCTVYCTVVHKTVFSSAVYCPQQCSGYSEVVLYTVHSSALDSAEQFSEQCMYSVEQCIIQ